MKKYLTYTLITIIACSNISYGFDMRGINLINPLENNPQTYQEELAHPSFELKRATLTKNSVKINTPLLWINLCRAMSVHLTKTLKC